MIKMDDDTLEELTGGGKCHKHYHETILTHDDLEKIQTLDKIVNITANYAALYEDDIIVADSTAGSVTVTLPLAKGQRQYIVSKAVATNNVVVNFSGGQNCFGQTSITLVALGAVARFRAHNNGWILV